MPHPQPLSPSPNPYDVRKPRRHTGEHDLLEALGRGGCPVCRLGAEAVDAFLASVCYEQVNDLDLREQLRAEGGFCPADARRFLAQRHGQLATAIVYRDVLANAARRLARADDARPPGSPGAALLGGLLRGRGLRPSKARRSGSGELRPCAACRVRAEAAERHLATLRGRVADPAVEARYRASDGLCLPHLERALEVDDAGGRILARAALDGLATLVDDLDDYIRKHDYRFRPERWQGGEDTPARAVERAVGHADHQA